MARGLDFRRLLRHSIQGYTPVSLSSPEFDARRVVVAAGDCRGGGNGLGFRSFPDPLVYTGEKGIFTAPAFHARQGVCFLLARSLGRLLVHPLFCFHWILEHEVRPLHGSPHTRLLYFWGQVFNRPLPAV